MTTPQMDWLDDQRRQRAVSSDDIVTRLRDYSARGAVFATNDMCWEAADEIERLRAAGHGPRPAVADLYRKRPVTVEAMGPLTAENAVEVQSWCGGTIGKGYGEPVALVIPTLEGQMIAWFGDYIIRGVQGEFYPCKPDIFAATYEPVEARRG